MNVVFCIVIVLLDQFVKIQVRSRPLGASLISLPPFLEIVHVQNTGAAFSLLQKHAVVVALISVVLLAAIFICIIRCIRLTRLARTALFCLAGGGIGNLLDRVLYGSVTDYIRILFLNFPVFNLADIAITLSILVLMLLICIDHLENNHGVKDGSAY